MSTESTRRRSRFTDEAIDAYASSVSTRPDTLQLALQRRTVEETGEASRMQIGDDQSLLIELIVRAMGAKRAVEVGTFTGYSSLAIARGLGDDGCLLCLDVSEEWTDIAREAWAEAGLSDRIELRIAPAAETLRSLPTEELFDFAFIDADKTGYAVYYEEILSRLRPGGLILLDNMLQSGRVIDPSADDESVRAIRALNEAIAADGRVQVVLLSVGDGVSVVQKR
jgi:caffeoyl-CoA O-methyltransferase